MEAPQQRDCALSSSCPEALMENILIGAELEQRPPLCCPSTELSCLHLQHRPASTSSYFCKAADVMQASWISYRINTEANPQRALAARLSRNVSASRSKRLRLGAEIRPPGPAPSTLQRAQREPLWDESSPPINLNILSANERQNVLGGMELKPEANR